MQRLHSTLTVKKVDSMGKSIPIYQNYTVLQSRSRYYSYCNGTLRLLSRHKLEELTAWQLF